MFIKDEFMKYVGNTSGNSYATGLKSIESIYNVNIDAEFEKDECKSLLKNLENAKKEKNISQTEQHKRRDNYSHLNKYTHFKRYKAFIEWFSQQPQKNDATKTYSMQTVMAAARLLKNGLKFLSTYRYKDIDCFSIDNPNEFKALYDSCYSDAEEYDKEKGHSDFRNGLDFYYSFLNNSNIEKQTPTKSKIEYIIEKYKDNFAAIDKDERYKWQAIATYKKFWNMDAPDFATMLNSAFKDTANLLRSGNYYPYKMLKVFAEKEPEQVRSLFKILYNENLPFEERRSKFQEGFIEYYKPQKLSHYQDLHAISVYLTCEYPDKYYIYKYSIVKDFIKKIDYECNNIDAMIDANKMELVLRLYNTVLSAVEQDIELQEMSKERLDDSCYQDEAFHMLTQDIIRFGSKLIKAEYWPSLDEYNPGITVQMWEDILQDKSLTPNEMLDILAKMLKIGGESTCYHMAEVYGKTHNYYNAMGSNFGKRVKERYNLPDCYDSEYDMMRYYTIPFVGRDVIEGDKTHYSWKLRDELKEALKNMDLDNIITNNQVTDVKLNTILYGPPGTGKTYHTVIYAVAIIENKPLAEIQKEDYEDVLDRYNEYKANERIAFTTFHQSYGYEEFIEGIKPIIVENADETKEVIYEVRPGVFKAFCDKIIVPEIKESADLELNDYPTIWKVSLEGTGDNPTRRECLDNNHIRIGYDECGEDATQAIENQENGYSVLNRFIYEMSVGDIVISCYTASTIDAIGVVIGEYEWHDEYSVYKRLRKVKWLVKNIDENIVKINNGKKLSNPTVHRVNITLNDIIDMVKKYSPEVIETENKGNYVFIIDEINRGNVSKILGELITLIEPKKRLGEAEEMEAILPYSNKPFGVPNNVYIIGTMNTADRSIATLDTALRRRFKFKEMLPNADVLKEIDVIDGISISNLLNTINKRITILYDREHTIGHAYFMPLKNNPSIKELSEIFENNIIPLLQEYFYEDYEKIRLVLGDNKKAEENQFIKAIPNDYSNIFGDVDVGLDEGYIYEINKDAFKNPEAYRSI